VVGGVVPGGHSDVLNQLKKLPGLVLHLAKGRRVGMGERVRIERRYAQWGRYF
jgi:hypothetical protein